MVVTYTRSSTRVAHLFASIRHMTLAALICTGAFSSACRNDESPASRAARSFAAAIPSGDSKRMLELIDRRSRAALEQAAHRASDQVGGRRNIEPHEMLQIVDVDPRFQIARAELIGADDETARVRLTGVDGSDHELALVYEDHAWKVSLPLPSPLPSHEP